MLGITTKLLIFVLSAVICDCGDTCEKDSCKAFQLNKKHLNKRLIGHGILDIALNVIHDCARHCFYYKICKSFDFNKKEQPSCKLNNVTGESAEATFEAKPGAVFSDITEWPSNMAGKCGQRLCSVTQRCLPAKDSFKCIDIKCGSIGPIPNAVTTLDNPGHMAYMDTASLSCDEGYETNKTSIQCQANGLWELSTCGKKECPVGNSWVHKEDMPNFKLQFHTERLRHSSAKEECENSNARLVRIDNEVKREYVRDILTTCEGLGNHNYWTDGSNTHAGHPGDYRMRFSNGDEMPLGVGHWQHDMPEIYDSAQMCSRMESYSDFRWRDAYCTESQQFICELLHR